MEGARAHEEQIIIAAAGQNIELGLSVITMISGAEALVPGTGRWQFMDGEKTVTTRPQGRFNADRIACLVGGYYLKDKVDFRTGLIATDTLGTTLVSDCHQECESKAAFAQADLNLTSRLTLTGGLLHRRQRQL